MQAPGSIRDLFFAMPRFANTAAIQNVNKTIQWKITGEDAGNYYLEIRNGSVTTYEGISDKADVTIEAPADVWMGISSGEINGAVAFMQGKFKATGDITQLMAMQNWFTPPR